jgi:hypothetical protein
MVAFDPAELRRDGVMLGPLPDERGRIIDGRTLPSAFAEKLRQRGLDPARPLRVVGVIAKAPTGELGLYSIRFEQA